MAKFQKGSRVIREDTQRKGVISQVFDEIRGRQIYLVNWGDSERKTQGLAPVPNRFMDEPSGRVKRKQ